MSRQRAGFVFASRQGPTATCLRAHWPRGQRRRATERWRSAASRHQLRVFRYAGQGPRRQTCREPSRTMTAAHPFPARRVASTAAAEKRGAAAAPRALAAVSSTSRSRSLRTSSSVLAAWPCPATARPMTAMPAWALGGGQERVVSGATRFAPPYKVERDRSRNGFRNWFQEFENSSCD